MINKLMLFISLFISAAVITLVGGIIKINSNSAASVSASVQSTLAQSSTETAYINLLNQANETINQANQRINDANNRISALEAQLQQQPLSATATPYPITADQASQTASSLVGLKPDGEPQLVNYSGTAAYEVTFASGKVYVDATTGSVLYNGIQVVQTVTPQQAATIAENYIGNYVLSGINSGYLGSTYVYQVLFENGYIVYVDTYGKIVSVQTPSNARGGEGSGSEIEND
jgi:TolA-binding protein